MINIKYFTSTSCGPCKMLSPIMEQLKNESDGSYSVTKFDVAEHSDLVKHFEITSVPHIIFEKQGEVKQTITGLRPKSVFIDIIKQVSEE